MSLGVSLAALMWAQVVGACALWPSKPVPLRPAKGMTAERINELVQETARLQGDLETMRLDRDRLGKNAAEAIEAKEKVTTERDELEIQRAALEMKCADLKAEAVRHRKAAVSASVKAAAKKEDED